MEKPLRSEAVFSRMVELRRAIHQHPELAFEEKETARLIMSELDRLGIPFAYGGKGHGVVGRLPGSKRRPIVALRADMDALPGTEITGLSFASKVPGKVHACGHDAHVAMLLGAAHLLKSNPPPGEVLFVFQPAEERGGGARVVLESGLLDEADAIFAGHVTHHYRTGEIMLAEGVITAQSDRFHIKVMGKGGHGARPHETIDAVVITGFLIMAMQTLVSRQINPVHPTVVTIGRVEAGTAANVIADEAVLEGTIRSTWPPSRERVHVGMERIARGIADLHGAQIEVSISEGYPPVINTPREVRIASAAARAVVGETGAVSMDYPSMGSEDFSYYLQKIPGCYVRFGARWGEEYIPLHSPAFDIDEEVLKVGAAWFDEVARQALRELAR